MFPNDQGGSIYPLNIAEGSSRSSVKDYNRFVEISLGSSYELETQVLIAQAVSFGDPELGKNLLAAIIEEQRMLSGFQKSLAIWAKISLELPGLTCSL